MLAMTDRATGDTAIVPLADMLADTVSEDGSVDLEQRAVYWRAARGIPGVVSGGQCVFDVTAAPSRP